MITFFQSSGYFLFWYSVMLFSIGMAYHHKISYHAVIKRTYDLVTHEIPFSELTVHQIVSAIYAAAEEQSK